MTILLQDLRYALRTLVSRPGFTAAGLLTLALGIGATTAVFSVVNGVLLRPLSYPQADRIVMIRASNPEAGFPHISVSPLNFRDWREQNQRLDPMVAILQENYNFTGGDYPERLRGLRVSAGFFSVMGVAPALGRGFLPEEDQPGGENVVVLSHGLWQRRFGGDPGIVDQTILLNGESYQVVGVAPLDFSFPRDMDVWAPIALDYNQYDRGDRWVYALGRLKPGATLAGAQADLSRIAAGLAQEYPDSNTGWGVLVEPLREVVVKNIRPALLVLLTAVAFVLLIAVANVANLFLARLTTREKEVTLRYALGASRTRLIRQLLTESVVLALLGGGLGLLLATWGTEALLARFADYIPRSAGVSVDGNVLGFTLLVSMAAGLVFGVMPALQVSGRNLAEPMGEAGRALTGNAGSGRLRRILVGVEVALALVLLVGASLLIRSFVNLVGIDPGFSAKQVLTMKLDLPEAGYAEDAPRIAFYRELLERIEALPGVASAATIEPMPLAGGWTAEEFTIEGRPVPDPSEAPGTNYRLASPGYFETMEIPLLAGRTLTEADSEGALPVAVINKTLADRFFPQGDAIDRRLTFDVPPTEDSVWFTIVGIVGDVRWAELDTEAGPETYVATLQRPDRFATLVVRAESDPFALAAPVRSVVQAVDPDLPVYNLRTVDELVALSLGQPRFATALLALFAAVALALAILGIYGVVSYSVSQRFREVGIRMALGASGSEVLRMVVGQGMVPVVAGVGAGVVGALGLTRFLASQIYGVSTMDPLIFAGVAAVLLLVALTASFLPARRATGVEPMLVLRHE
ncbi:MAG: ABC transporter permease [bacterium]|nr:ABC transporter permease [bacterium]